MIGIKTEALVKSLFAKDENGKFSMRVVLNTPAEPGTLENAVNKHSNRSLETLLSNSIVLDEDGNHALRLTPVQFGKTLEDRERERRTPTEE